MQSGTEDTGARAAVVPLAAVRETRAEARRLAVDCPGWRCWYAPQARLWYGRRIIDGWATEPTGRTYIATAGSAAMLWAVITTQAILDLAFEFADWNIECSPGGFWWATWAGADDDRRHSIIGVASPIKLAAALRRYVEMWGDQDDPRPSWLGGRDDC
jgi:hypothetical protein